MEHQPYFVRLRQSMRLLAPIVILFCFTHGTAQNMQPIKMAQLDKIMLASKDEVKVINFWASWCGPCVKELPYFDELAADEGLDVSLVSLDFIEDINKASALLKKKGIKSNSYLLDESNYVDLIDKSWTGAIPATLILDQNGNRYFYEKAFSQTELQEIVRNITSK